MLNNYYAANGMKFSTSDTDNDLSSLFNLAEVKGPWWWNESGAASLNGGVYGGGEYDGPYWKTFTNDGYALTAAAMKLRQIPQ